MTRRRDDGADRPAAAHVRPQRVRNALRVCARVGGIGLFVIAGIALVVFGVFPTRTWLDQRAAAERAEEHLRVLGEQNDALEERIAELQTDAAIEALARERYNLVRPGEEAYAVLPAPPAAVELPPIWPFGPITEPPPGTESPDTAIPRDE